MAHIISVTNEKGGVGKTTTAQTLARELAKKNKVLLIDWDTQRTLTKGYNLEVVLGDSFNEYMLEHSSEKIFEREAVSPLDITFILDEHVTCSKLKYKELHFLPSPGRILGKIADSARGGKDLMLKHYLKKIKEDYDYIIIDSIPSSTTTLFSSSVVAADSILVPIQTKHNAIMGANEFIETVDEIISDYEIKYKNVFILPIMYNSQRTDDKAVLAEIQTDYLEFIATCDSISKAEVTILPTIPERANFSKAQSFGYSVQDYTECFDKGNRDLLLTIENIVKKIKKMQG